MTIHQGDVYMVNLNVDSIDHEQKGIRPCVIMSVDMRNDTSDNVFIFPITHAKKKNQLCHYILYKEKYPFFTYNENIVLCEEGRSISKSRLERKLGMIFYKDIVEIIKCKEYIYIDKDKITY